MEWGDQREDNKKRGPQPSSSSVRDPLQAFLVLGQHAQQSAVGTRPIPMASVQAENIVGAAEVIDADVAVVPGFEVLLRLFADHGVCLLCFLLVTYYLCKGDTGSI